ncbi:MULTISPECIES: 4'-phosphopantetheinyl transferase family protein [Flavobacteriaceae]|uniref:4'-phosphopantetheinyl transferase superfamily protein n=2 Tax=Flavobacteriaceae TaxID=49546 RepID=A0A4Y8APX8_9FLAO|nr:MULTISPECIES: 4'-phosphopantetheinyl transferase family protein [Flavobacteriaceae]TEW72863.1 4'-phosphopantetheinyl transferase superfamily protein [Gramella jeungdoensis]GGK49050.1 4'-phosphopantetheinyl transferase [Lutibacter litoralis]
MPLFKTIKPNKYTTVYVWKIEESFKDLSKNMLLTERSESRLLSMKSEIHRRGFLSVRHLLKEAGYTDLDLFYNGNGKPHLTNGKHISITHSFIFSAIIISDVEVGIDIEKNREKIKIIQDKFVNFERGFIHKDDDYIQQLTVIWGAKESLYKIYPHGGLTFKNDIDINSFQIADKKTSGYIKVEGWDKNYRIEFHQIDGFTLVYALDIANND